MWQTDPGDAEEFAAAATKSNRGELAVSRSVFVVAEDRDFVIGMSMMSALLLAAVIPDGSLLLLLILLLLLLLMCVLLHHIPFEV